MEYVEEEWGVLLVGGVRRPIKIISSHVFKNIFEAIEAETVTIKYDRIIYLTISYMFSLNGKVGCLLSPWVSQLDLNKIIICILSNKCMQLKKSLPLHFYCCPSIYKFCIIFN